MLAFDEPEAVFGLVEGVAPAPCYHDHGRVGVWLAPSAPGECILLARFTLEPPSFAGGDLGDASQLPAPVQPRKYGRLGQPAQLLDFRPP
jgi:hypothetical protein